MAIDGGGRATLLANPGVPMTITLDMRQPRLFVAQIAINMLDPLVNYDRDNAVAADIPLVDDQRTPSSFIGGDHWGESGADSNVFRGSFVGTGQKVTFRVRVMGPDESAGAEGMLVF